MIENIYQSPSLIEEVKRSPFGNYVERLVSTYIRNGLIPKNLQGPLGIIIRFVRWSAHHGITPKNISKKHVSQFLSERRPSSNGKLRCIQLLLRMIEDERNIELVKREVPPYLKNKYVLEAVEEFKKFMQKDLGLLPTSIDRFKTSVAQFLHFSFASRIVRLRALKPQHALEFLSMRGKSFRARTLRTDAAALKCYFKFLFVKGKIISDLSRSIPKISIWHDKEIIDTIKQDEMAKLLESCNLDTHSGVRDYAILLLLIRYGLRPIEIARMSLRDFHLKDQKITIRGKGSKVSVLPLTDDVNRALSRYVNSARPSTTEQAIFVCAKAPFQKFSSSGAISHIVCRAIHRSGLKVRIHGARLLRYSVASAILNNGGNLLEVRELLRHSSIDTSVRYTRLDFNKLSKIAQPWPSQGSKE